MNLTKQVSYATHSCSHTGTQGEPNHSPGTWYYGPQSRANF